jgi:hypothetical protein
MGGAGIAFGRTAFAGETSLTQKGEGGRWFFCGAFGELTSLVGGFREFGSLVGGFGELASLVTGFDEPCPLKQTSTLGGKGVSRVLQYGWMTNELTIGDTDGLAKNFSYMGGVVRGRNFPR